MLFWLSPKLIGFEPKNGLGLYRAQPSAVLAQINESVP
jgi:hypothetical protein